MRDKNQITNYEQLKNKINYFTPEELNRVTEAYEFANEKHQGQFRKSGEAYIIHPLNVAYILSEIKADVNTIIAALLHDTIEDCDVTEKQLEEKFTKEVSDLVDSLTKINQLNLSAETDALIANQRKLLVGMTKDVRAIILKLADRLHNMRTIWALSEKSQKANAKETLDILTPLAHRLGIFSIKTELEDLSLRYLKPEVYYQIVETLSKTKIERESCIIKMKEDLSQNINDLNIDNQIKGRVKSIYSIYNKLNKGKTFNELYDLYALRVFVNTKEECYQVLGAIHSNYTPIPKRFKDYIAMPKTNLYQSLHTTVFGYNQTIYEIQIRTYEMDKIAENGIASHWSYKEKKSIHNKMEDKLQFFRTIMEIKNNGGDDEHFVQTVKEDVLNDTIYIFSPKGDVIELPKGSTPIDFAYRVHSKIGETMVSAIVNNNIVPLNYQLNNNDIVKINTSPNASPSYEWVNVVKTSGARAKIKAYFSKEAKEEHQLNGELILQKELRARKIPFTQFYDNVKEILIEHKCADIIELHINIGNKKIPVESLFIKKETQTKEEKILNKISNNSIKSESKNEILVQGIDDVKVNIALCCKPVKGDNIIGYITKSNGISIHRLECPNVLELQERFVTVNWNETINTKSPTSLIIRANDNVLLEIVAKTSNTDIVISNIINLNNFSYEVTALFPNKEKLDKYMNDLSNISDITSVTRIIK